ncbi:hypothetical protein IAI18_18965 [Acetobacteraceae bacterium H6797]|nr:hypothetical protein [Acetobacteraceae bacterium H6797]
MSKPAAPRARKAPPKPAPRKAAVRKAPWDFHPALTGERLAAAARLLVQGRKDALALADYWAGDDSWSIGCRAYSFSRHQVRRAAEAGRYPWLKVLDATHHFVFLIDGVPVRFFRGDAEDPNRRTLRQQQDEAAQLSLALGNVDAAEGLMFRLAVETDTKGEVARVVFLALRGEEGRAECFWPVPLHEEAVQRAAQPRAAHRHRLAPLQQLAFG